MALALNYARMPGPGDFGFPEEEPAFDRDDAINSITCEMIGNDEVAELVMHVANARRLLTWLSSEVVIPEALRADWAVLERDAIALDRRIDREYAALNGEVA